MNLLNDIITYIRRIIKSPSNAVITDDLIIDYINRFWLMDVDARVQLFDLKTQYQFQTIPGVDQYNMPLYDVQTQPGGQTIGMFPVYQGFMAAAFINGIEASFYTQRQDFFNLWPNYVQSFAPVAIGNGTAGPYTIQVPVGSTQATSVNQIASGILRGHVDITGIIATGINVDPPLVQPADAATGDTIPIIPSTSVYSAIYFTSTDQYGNNVVVADSGQFLAQGSNYGLLMQPGAAPNGNLPLTNGPSPYYSTTQNTFNYVTGTVTNLYFPTAIPDGQNINAQCFWINPGLPRAILYYNNILTLRSVPDIQYLVQLNAYLSPAAFLNTSAAIPFGYMAEYIARGAARKILSDTGDVEQFTFYEPFFKEQEILVWKRSQRQFTSTRTETLYSSQGFGTGSSANGLYGSGAT